MPMNHIDSKGAILHRVHPRRVLTALRFLPTEPKRPTDRRSA